ncbi:type II secretion system protein F [Nocardioides sp. zg-579]|uniref:Type II secretion system protein F n=1 Tax=Nocardioides marmotae TaxID=2663857 RepID=A0A6I3JFL5_9ACTN|nr:type II secretion system F family protein [Nocardioides marmotae]MCR6033367.1 type II secretion system protein F [Gordonia jinghuaiqii]MTB97024.1 type II secretion system protein F [Nocardioides marmotae]QKE00597.1 type II secretion system protein F [Nocardioides marmotae]
MGALVGLGVGVGLLLVWSAFFLPRGPRPVVRAEGRTQRLLARAGLRSVSPASFLALCLVSGALVAVVVQAVSGTAPVALAFGAMGGYLPVAVVSGRARRRQRELAEVWPEAVDHLTSAVRAGMSLPDALAALGTRGPEPLQPAFADFALDYQVTGRFGECLDRLKDRLADPVGDRVVEGLRVAREVGGGELGRLLRNLSGYLRDDLRTRSELEARQAWTVNGARLAVAAPWLVLLFMSFQSEVIRRYASPGGVVVLVVGAATCVLAYRLMMRIGRLPVERRILS